nr:hypothetical protein [Tanacetum cinerariifolium]
KFEQWQFWIQQYLQHEHYALWEVIEFGDLYVVPASPSSTTTTDTTSDESSKKSGRTVTLTAEVMQKKKNDTKKNLLKQRYGNFKAEGSETLEQTFNRLQVIVGQLQFMDVEVEQDDLNQKFLTSLSSEWLMHTIVWRNRSDLDTMSLDDLYNHLKVYDSKVHKKLEPDSQNMAFISSGKHSSGNEDGNTACVSTASTNVPTASASVATISQDTACAYITSQSSALLSMRADKFWKKTGKKIIIQGSDVGGFDKSKVECFNCHKMGHFARECRAPRSQERGRRDNYRQGSKAEEQAPKALMAIDRVGWDWSYMANNEEDHALVADEVAPTEFALMANTSAESKKLETLKEEKEGVNGKLAGLLTASKDLDNLIESQRPSPTVKSTSGDDQNRNPFVFETVASPITPKPFIKFVKPKDSQLKSKTGKIESPKKPPVKYAEQYRKPNKKPNVRGNQRNWNNLKSHQLGPDFVMKKKSCFNCGDYNHLAYDCRKREFTPKPVVHRPYKPSQRPVRTNMNGARPNRTSFNKQAHSYANRPFHRTLAVRSHYRAPWVPTVNRSFPPVNKKLSTGSRNFPTANRKFPTASRKFPTGSTKCSTADMRMKGKAGSSSNKIDDKGYWDSGCSRHMIGTKGATGQEVKKDASSLRYIAIPNWTHDALLEFSLSKPQDHCSTEVPEGNGNLNPTASTSNPSADQIETLTVETPIPTVSSPVPTAYSTDSQEPSSDARLSSKRVANQVEIPSLDNILSLTNRFEDILEVTTNLEESNGVETDIKNMETAITARTSPKRWENAPRAWYGTLSKYLLKNGFQRGTIDQTLFIRREFEAFMHEKFQMSAMGELNFFLGLYSDVRSSNTPMDNDNLWEKDGTVKDVDLHLYRSMIGSLMYLTTSRPDIMFAICACARHQTIVATSTTEAEYVAAASCYGQVLWISCLII